MPPRRPTAAHAGRTFAAEVVAALAFATCFEHSGATWRGFARFARTHDLPGADVFAEVFAPGLDAYARDIYGFAFFVAGLIFVSTRSLPWGTALAVLGLTAAAFLDLGTGTALWQVVSGFVPGILLASLARSTLDGGGWSWWLFWYRLQEALLGACLYLFLILIALVPAASALATAAR